ncbi:hypothetical protein AAHC03_024248 [Spirometra sp. Aus1]
MSNFVIRSPNACLINPDSAEAAFSVVGTSAPSLTATTTTCLARFLFCSRGVFGTQLPLLPPPPPTLTS